MTVTTFIGLGGNLANPVEQLQKALQSLKRLPESRLACCSSFYRTPPLTDSLHPSEPQPDYMNAVAILKTSLPPFNLLKHLQLIETQQGRIRDGRRWRSRTLDLDMLLYGGLQMQHPRLTLPHPGIPLRAFVLYPLAECQPNLIFPDGVALKTLLAHCTDNSLERIPNMISC